MKVHIITHENFESPAAIGRWLQHNKHHMSHTHLYLNDELPSTADDFDVLIIMGGPQSPSTTKEECPHFDGPKELELIRQAIQADKKVLGVCLGAQMIGEALGACYEHSPNKEIGVFEVSLTDEAKNDPIIGLFPNKFMVGHWHGDMPGLPADAALLATSAGCPRQIIRFKPGVYGFQCHFEFTHHAVKTMVNNCGHELVAGQPYIQSADELKAYDYSAMNDLLFLFLDKLISD